MNANTVTPEHVAPLADHIREHAARVMGAEKAGRLAEALAACDTLSTPKAGGHKLAADAAKNLLDHGKLRQAEKAYVELVAKHDDLDSIIGLAKTQVALEDTPAALETLRAAAARLAKAGRRGDAVSLLASAVAFGPADLSSHRRLAAALANQGDLPGAIDEYRRYVDECIAQGDPRRAMLELAYGRETLGELPGLLALVDRVQNPGRERFDAPQPPARKPVIARPTPPLRIAEPVAEAAKPAPLKVETPAAKLEPAATPEPRPEPPMKKLIADAKLIADVRPAPKPSKTTEKKPAAEWGLPTMRAKTLAEAEAAKAAPAAKTQPAASDTAVHLEGAKTVTHAEVADLEAPMDLLARTGFTKKKEPRPAIDIEPILRSLIPVGSGLDAAATAASRAALLTSARDARATEAVLDAARRLLALGKIQSASDVLLDYIGHGFTDREAHRLLIEIDCGIGRRDVAKEKCGLLSHAYRLDGRNETAEDVERLGRIL